MTSSRIQSKGSSASLLHASQDEIASGPRIGVDYAGDDALTAEWLIYFCTKLIESGIPFKESQVLVNMYVSQVNKIRAIVNKLHEDLQQDYQNDLDKLIHFLK